MFSVEEAASKLGVSKVTVYAKLKKYDDMVVLKQGRKYITEDLLSLIKQDLKVKDIETNSLNEDISDTPENEAAVGNEELLELNKELIKLLTSQLQEKDRQIQDLTRLLENSQVLLKQEQEQPLQLEARFNAMEERLDSIKDNMEQRREAESKRSFWSRFRKE